MQGEDLEAINRFMMTEPTKTPQAVKLRDEWAVWWGRLSFLEKHVDGATYNVARNKRNAFIRANATTPAEREHAEMVIRTGLSTEEMQGGVRQSTSTGDYDEGGGFPWVWVGIGVGSIAGAIVLHKLLK